MSLLLENKKLAAATHNIMAYRIDSGNGVWSQDCDDDGETGARPGASADVRVEDILGGGCARAELDLSTRSVHAVVFSQHVCSRWGKAAASLADGKCSERVRRCEQVVRWHSAGCACSPRREESIMPPVFTAWHV